MAHIVYGRDPSTGLLFDWNLRYVNRPNVPESGIFDAAKAPNGGQWWTYASPAQCAHTAAAEAKAYVEVVSETKALAAKLRPKFTDWTPNRRC